MLCQRPVGEPCLVTEAAQVVAVAPQLIAQLGVGDGGNGGKVVRCLAALREAMGKIS